MTLINVVATLRSIHPIVTVTPMIGLITAMISIANNIQKTGIPLERAFSS